MEDLKYIYENFLLPFLWIEILGVLTIIISWLFLKFTNKSIKDFEKYLLKNLSGACVLVIAIISLSGLNYKLDKEYSLTAIGAIIIFWYGYKTYERDKGTQFITDFLSRLKEFKLERNPDNLCFLDFYYNYFILSKVGYLNEDVWLYIQSYFSQEIEDYIQSYLIDQSESAGGEGHLNEQLVRINNKDNSFYLFIKNIFFNKISDATFPYPVAKLSKDLPIWKNHLKNEFFD